MRLARSDGKKSKANLTDKQRRFAEEYPVDLNPCAAALRAGYNSGEVGWHLMCEPRFAHVQKAVKRELDKRSKRTAITADRVLEELACIAFLNPKELTNEDGSLRDVREMDDNTARAIASFEHIYASANAAEKRKLTTNPKLGALELIGKHLTMWTDRVEHTAPEGFTFRIIAPGESK